MVPKRSGKWVATSCLAIKRARLVDLIGRCAEPRHRFAAGALSPTYFPFERRRLEGPERRTIDPHPCPRGLVARQHPSLGRFAAIGILAVVVSACSNGGGASPTPSVPMPTTAAATTQAA